MPAAPRTSPRRRWMSWLDTAALLGAAGVLAWIAFASWFYLWHAHAMSDDFWLAVQGREVGPVGYANAIYAEKSGRWAGSALISFALSQVDLGRSYPWLLIPLVLINLGATYALLRVLLGDTASRREVLAWAIGFEALLWAGRPVPSETVYWFSGAVPYQLSLSCSVVLSAGLIARSRAERTGVAWRVVFVLLPPFVAGLQELVGVMLTVVLAAGTWMARRHLPARSLWLWSTLASLAGCVVSLTAPGNDVRAAEWPHTGDIVLTLRTTFEDSLLFTRQWILEPRLLSASLFLWLSPAFRSLRPRWIDSGTKWLPTVTLAALLSLALLIAGPRWAMGTLQPPRMTAVDYTVLFHAWFVILFLCTRGTSGLPRSETACCLGRVAALVVLAYSLLFTGYGRSALSDLSSGRLARWHEYMEARQETLRAAAERGDRRLVLEPPPDFPWLFEHYEQWMDITDDPRNGRNRFLARYYGLRSVALAKPPASAPAPPK